MQLFGVPVVASTLVMRAAPSSASAGILESTSMGSRGHLLLALVTMLVVLSWLWPAVTSAEPSPCHRTQLPSPVSGLRGLLPGAGWELCMA